VQAPDAQVDNIEHIDPEISQIVFDPAREIGRRQRRDPGGIGAAHGPDLGHNHQLARIRMQCLVDQAVGDVRPVEVTRVSM
jgi:hypothetical protein